MLDPIELTVTVPVAQETAFDAFVLRIDDWWPMTGFSMVQGVLLMEPKLGGFIVETGPDGQKFNWGHITAWDRPRMLELAWYVGRTVDTATQVLVTFRPHGPAATEITLVQTGWEALGENAAEMRPRNVAGWTEIIGKQFVAFVSNMREL